MRLAAALASSLLFTASAALAAPPSPDQSAGAPQDQRTQPGASAAGAEGREQQNASGTPASPETSPRLTPTKYPTFKSGATGADVGTEANCYYVYGDLRCDRVPARTPK